MTQSSNGSRGLDLSQVDATVAAAIRRRKANRREGQNLEQLPVLWRQRSIELQRWSMKTHFAIVLTGLIAKATDDRVDPRVLRVEGDAETGRFSAPQVWRRFYTRAVEAGISTNKLKSAPHNNQPYLARSAIERTTSSTNPETARCVAQVYDWLTELNALSKAAANSALDAFLVEVPDADGPPAPIIVIGSNVTPRSTFQPLADFLEADTEDGRRGQAFVAACMTLLHGEDVETPESVNDPSFNSLGDATIKTDTKLQGAEAKQKIVKLADVRNTARDLAAKAPQASLIYAALVNAEDGVPLAKDWRTISEDTGILVVVHDDPSTMLRDAIIASALPFANAVVEFCRLYRDKLFHVGVRPETIEEFSSTMTTMGIALGPDSDQAVGSDE